MNGMMKRLKSKELELLQFPGLAGCCNISHFITTRHGGVSRGAYASMNPSRYCGDEVEAVQENLERLADVVGISAQSIVYPYQVHGCEVRTLDASFLALSPQAQRDFLEGVDAVVTNLPTLCVAVTTADCVPILLYAPDCNVVAAIHAGWRGTVQQIVARTVALMVANYGVDTAQLLAGIAPSIGRGAFEVGDEVVEAFRLSGAELTRIAYRNEQSGKMYIDLWEANRLQLVEAGVLAAHIECSEICTYSHQDTFFSARRLGINSGRILSGIWIKEN